MKRKSLLAAALLCAASSQAHAQVSIVSAPILEILAENDKVEKAIYFAQSLVHMAENAKNTYDQIQNMIRQEERALQNLQGIRDVSSYDEFMDWYNDQLYLERQAENSFKNMSVTIGGESSVKVLDMIIDPSQFTGAVKKEFVDYWSKEFTPEQRKKMWLNLGLTPSNYAYLQTWEAIEKPVLEKILGNPEALKADNAAAAERNAKTVEAAMDPDTGEKGVAQAGLQIALDTNQLLRGWRFDMAEYWRRQAAEEEKAKVPTDTAIVAEWEAWYFDTLDSLGLPRP